MYRFINSSANDSDISNNIMKLFESKIKDFFKNNPDLDTLSDHLTVHDSPQFTAPIKKVGKYEYAVRVTRNIKNPDLEYYIEIWMPLFPEDAQDLCYYLDDYLEDFIGYEGSVDYDEVERIDGYMSKILSY